VSSSALICDTGALLDFLVRTSPDHDFFRRAIDAARTRFIPGLVLAELDYFLREERAAMRALVDDIGRGAFVYAPPTDAQLVRALDTSIPLIPSSSSASLTRASSRWPKSWTSSVWRRATCGTLPRCDSPTAGPSSSSRWAPT